QGRHQGKPPGTQVVQGQHVGGHSSARMHPPGSISAVGSGPPADAGHDGAGDTDPWTNGLVVSVPAVASWGRSHSNIEAQWQFRAGGRSMDIAPRARVRVFMA